MATAALLIKPSPYHWKTSALNIHYETLLTHRFRIDDPRYIHEDWRNLAHLYDCQGNFALLDAVMRARPVAQHPLAHRKLIAHGSRYNWNVADMIFSRYLPGHRFSDGDKPRPPGHVPSPETVESYDEVLWWAADGLALLAVGLGELADIAVLRVIAMLEGAAAYINHTVKVVEMRHK